MSNNVAISVVRPGDRAAAQPFTVCIVANPALESPEGSALFLPDPIISDQSKFNTSVQYIDNALFGNLPAQKERLLAEPTVAPKVRVMSVFAADLVAADENSLVAEFADLLVPRRDRFVSFLNRYSVLADVVYAVSDSTTHTRASAWFTSDDNSRPGVDFVLDGSSLCHRYYNAIPGTIAIHTSAESLTALHEFQHAISSYENGRILDLYVDTVDPGLNCKVGRPIPPNFAIYNGTIYKSDPARDNLGYPPEWQSYHCELLEPAFPAIMDDYWEANGAPENCQNDKVTRAFIVDRIHAKLSR